MICQVLEDVLFLALHTGSRTYSSSYFYLMNSIKVHIGGHVIQLGHRRRDIR